MGKKNLLLHGPPYEVESQIRRFGRNLRVARLRRNLTIAQVARKIGTGPRAVADAERGRLGTGVAVYAALLWVYGLPRSLSEVAEPDADKAGMALERLKGRKRARAAEGADNDF